ncbi:MAG: response regulator transcription factor [Treponema sp.]|nr:response regulator transcription factor [Treponema sp.]
MIKVLIVEDQAMLKDSLEYILNNQDDIAVAGVTDDASNAPQLCRELKPDLVLMDVITKDANGIVFAAKIRKEMPQIKIVIMTAFPEITFVDEARKAGAHSFIYKSSGKEHLLYVIRSTMRGIGYYPGPVNNPPSVDQLTEREIAIVRHIHQGIPRGEIIKELNISEMTLKKDINSILNKTGFDSIMEFAVYTAVNNLILPLTANR